MAIGDPRRWRDKHQGIVDAGYGILYYVIILAPIPIGYLLEEIWYGIVVTCALWIGLTYLGVYLDLRYPRWTAKQIDEFRKLGRGEVIIGFIVRKLRSRWVQVFLGLVTVFEILQYAGLYNYEGGVSGIFTVFLIAWICHFYKKRFDERAKVLGKNWYKNYMAIHNAGAEAVAGNSVKWGYVGVTILAVGSIFFLLLMFHIL